MTWKMRLPARDKRESTIRYARRQQLLILIGTLVAGVGLAAYFEIPSTYVIAGSAAWVIVSLHLSMTEAILHFDELNWHMTIRNHNDDSLH